MKAVKRIVSTSFWTDPMVSDTYSCEDKYFMLYLLTNPHTTQLGIYPLPISQAANELGYSKENVKVLIDRFEKKYDTIRYSEETGELAIKNFLRHSIVKGGKPVFDCLVREEECIKNKSLVSYVIDNLCSNTNTLNATVLEFINYIKVKENDKDNENDNDNDNDNERIVDESSKSVYFPNDAELDEAFCNYVIMRKFIKKPLTQYATELAIKRLGELAKNSYTGEFDPDVAIQILNQSIMNSWQGLFPLKQEAKKQTGKSVFDEWRDA